MKHAPSCPSPSFASFVSPGFTLVELLIATAIMTTVSGAFVSLILSAQSIARTQPEAADQQQRARMAVQALAADVARAGGGLDRGANAGPLAASNPTRIHLIVASQSRPRRAQARRLDPGFGTSRVVRGRFAGYADGTDPRLA